MEGLRSFCSFRLGREGLDFAGSRLMRTRQIKNSFLEQAAADREYVSQDMQELDVGKAKALKVLIQGEGDPIIFIPMITELNFLYVPQLEAFSSAYRVILYEPHLSCDFHVGIIDRAKETIALMDALRLESAHIVSWSDAGAAAYQLAKTWPERCKSVIFLGLPDKYILKQPTGFLMKILGKLPIEKLVPSRLLAHFLARFMKGPQVRHSWVVQAAMEVPKLSRLFKHSCLPNMLEHNPSAGEVKVPSVVISGDSDPVVSCEKAHRMARMLSENQNAVIIPEGEHLLGYVNSVEVNQAMHEFYSLV